MPLIFRHKVTEVGEIVSGNDHFHMPQSRVDYMHVEGLPNNSAKHQLNSFALIFTVSQSRFILSLVPSPL